MQSCLDLSEDADSNNICPFPTNLRREADLHRQRGGWRE
jgi:hypothetical protein